MEFEAKINKRVHLVKRKPYTQYFVFIPKKLHDKIKDFVGKTVKVIIKI